MTEIADLVKQAREYDPPQDSPGDAFGILATMATRLERIAAAWAQADAVCVFTEDDQFKALRAAIEGHEP